MRAPEDFFEGKDVLPLTREREDDALENKDLLLITEGEAFNAGRPREDDHEIVLELLDDKDGQEMRDKMAEKK